MSPENRRRLADRVAKAAEASLAAQNYVSPVDVLVGIGWFDAGAVKRLPTPCLCPVLRCHAFWDAGFDVGLGDAVNGFLVQDQVPTWAAVEEWLHHAPLKSYPNSA